MASKNISIKEETYKKLLSLKKGEESFTEIIENLLQKNNATIDKLTPFFGLYCEEPFMTHEEFELNRNELNQELKHLREKK